LKDQRDIARVERIEKSISKLEYLYRKISHFIKRDLYKIEREKVSLDKVIKERVEIFEDFRKNGFILDLEPLVVEIDKFALEEALDNLIENSMKYSDKDIKIELKGDILTIKDRGVGMEPSELLRVFERYYQGKGAKKGEGIGLYLVKRFCDEEDILLKIESQKDQGTSVILDFSKRVVKNGV
ncbi:MAG: HAMP domain-containing histidine kinase, partial [Epsilonproteobacteria bacterium]|nr:HAMP domain-containing histidine kinase [Campylobacterota bacterium]